MPEDGNHTEVEADVETVEKTIETHLVANWKDGSSRSRKTEPKQSELSPHEFVLPVSIDVVVPEMSLPELNARVEVPVANVEADMMEDEVEQRDPESWKGAADEAMEYLADDHDGDEWSFIYEATGRALSNADVLADPNEVRAYVRARVQSGAFDVA